MRRITIALMSTLSGLVLLFSYHTSTNSPAEAAQRTDGAGTADGATGTGADRSVGANGTAQQSSSSAQPSPGVGPAQDDPDQGAGLDAPGASPSPSPSTPEVAPGQLRTGTWKGTTVPTEWGPVQVVITVKNGKIVKANAPVVPDGNGHDREINSYAVPQLNQRVLDNQSANFDAISGATVTSDGYLQSLQSAIDKARA